MDVKGYEFRAAGRQALEAGWRAAFPDWRPEEEKGEAAQALPALRDGQAARLTALYEWMPAGADKGRIAPLRYRKGEAATPQTDFEGEYAFVKIRYKRPGAETSSLITRAVSAADAFASTASAPRDVRFAAAGAAFGELLRGGRYSGDYGYRDVIALAQGARGEDLLGYRNEFVRLVRLAESIAKLER